MERQATTSSLPVPDPTALTTEQLHREILSLRELIEKSVSGEIKVLNEKFHTVAAQFELVERQRVEQKSDTKAAVDAALTAQKEAVREQTIASERAIAKSEAGTTKQLEQLSENFNTALSGLNTLLLDLKDRVTRLESAKTAVVERDTSRHQTNAGMYLIIGLIFSGFGVLIAVAALFAAYHK